VKKLNLEKEPLKNKVVTKTRKREAELEKGGGNSYRSNNKKKGIDRDGGGFCGSAFRRNGGVANSSKRPGHQKGNKQ